MSIPGLRFSRTPWTVTILACCSFTVLFAIQYRLDLVPRSARLTFSECFSDKFHLPRVRERKREVEQARAKFASGDAGGAARELEKASRLGEDRELLELLCAAYRASGDQGRLAAAGRRLQAALAAELP